MNDPLFRVLRVALEVPLRRFFDYLPVPEVPLDQQQPGCRVLVPFGRRTLVGVIVAVSPQSDIAPASLRPAQSLLDSAPILAPHLLQLCAWAADYYQHAPGEVYLQALPTALRQPKPIPTNQVQAWQIQPDFAVDSLPKQAYRQKELAEFLLQQARPVPESEIREEGFSKAQILKLASLGALEEVTMEAPPAPVSASLEPALELNPAQQSCLDVLQEVSDRHQGLLLYGVTGSGKTEVYLHWIAYLLQSGRQVLVLIPEISLTPQTLARFERRFGPIVAAYHSGLTELERLRSWERARKGEARIIIGTRSSVFMSFQALGAIIVDEEHDASFKQQDGFRYSARDLALVRGKLENLPVLLGSATPSLESLHNVELGKYKLLRLENRAGAAQKARINLLDIKSRPLQAGLSQPLIEQIQQHLDRREQVLLFINRRGYAPVLMCHDCGWIAECRHCDARLTLHKRAPQLRCHHCEASAHIPPHCPQCGGPALRPIGTGTERTEDELQRLFPNYPVHRVDSDTTRSKRRFAAMLDHIHEGEPCLLVGTQILAKGHHFPKVTLVAVINADSGLFSSDFRATERMLQTLVQVAGRAGRADAPGTVVIQTHHGDHPLMQSLTQDDYLEIAHQLLQERELAQLPPYHCLTLIQAEAPYQDQAMAWLTGCKREAEAISARSNNLDIRLSGPMPAIMEKRAGRYRAQLHLSAPNRAPLRALLSQLLLWADGQRLPNGLRWSVDVDPIDLL